MPFQYRSVSLALLLARLLPFAFIGHVYAADPHLSTSARGPAGRRHKMTRRASFLCRQRRISGVDLTNRRFGIDSLAIGCPHLPNGVTHAIR